MPIIKRAHEMGYYVIAADGNPEAVGLQYADKAICANIVSEDVMLEIARNEHIDGVIHPCSEVSMNVMGRINDELHLCGISKEIAIRATNKHLMREAFAAAGMDRKTGGPAAEASERCPEEPEAANGAAGAMLPSAFAVISFPPLTPVLHPLSIKYPDVSALFSPCALFPRTILSRYAVVYRSCVITHRSYI